MMAAHPRTNLRSLAVAALVAGAAAASPALAAKGYVVLATGRCLGAYTPIITLSYGSPGSIFTRNLKDFPDDAVKYKDDLGEFQVSINYLEAGDWVIENHSHKSDQYGNPVVAGPKYEYRFTVVAGKVLYLGRFCAATQDEYVDTIFGRRKKTKLDYVLVTSNRERDIQVAATKEPELAGMEVVDGVPRDPSSVTPSWRSTPVEPRVLGKP